MTPQEIEAELISAGIPNPHCRLDYTNERYRVTAHTTVLGQTHSRGMIVDTEATAEALKDVIEKFRLWHNELVESHRPD